MRISTHTLFESGAARLSELQSDMVKTQQQISTGRRVLTPADDPVAAARALEVTQSQSMNSQYGVNRDYAKSSLAAVEGSLTGVTELLQDVKTTIVAAGNATLGDMERGYMATELRGRFEQLLGMANSRDGQGNYLFSGFQTATPAFSKDASNNVTYDGDAGQRLMQVDTTRQLAVSHSGQAIFQGGGQDVFKALNDLIAVLETPGTAGLTAGLETANGKIDLALDNVLTVRASVGSRLQEIDALDSAGEDRHIQYSEILSGLQDLDYTQALTELSKQQLTLEAAQKSFVKASGLSLFNFI